MINSQRKDSNCVKKRSVPQGKQESRNENSSSLYQLMKRQGNYGTYIQQNIIEPLNEDTLVTCESKLKLGNIIGSIVLIEIKHKRKKSFT